MTFKILIKPGKHRNYDNRRNCRINSTEFQTGNLFTSDLQNGKLNITRMNDKFVRFDFDNNVAELDDVGTFSKRYSISGADQALEVTDKTTGGEHKELHANHLSTFFKEHNVDTTKPMFLTVFLSTEP